MSTHNQPKGSFNSSVPGRTKRPSSMRGIVVPSAFSTANRLQFAVRNRDVRVASEVCFRRIFFPFCRNLVLARDYFFSVRVVHRAVLRPGVAGVAHRKMRAHLLCNQDRQFSGDAILLCYHVRRRVRSDGKLTDRQRPVVIQQVFFYISTIVPSFSKFAQSYAVIMPSVSVRQRSR